MNISFRQLAGKTFQGLLTIVKNCMIWFLFQKVNGMESGLKWGWLGTMRSIGWLMSSGSSWWMTLSVELKWKEPVVRQLEALMTSWTLNETMEMVSETMEEGHLNTCHLKLLFNDLQWTRSRGLRFKWVIFKFVYQRCYPKHPHIWILILYILKVENT